MMATCKRGLNCAFYHNILERRQPPSSLESPHRPKPPLTADPGLNKEEIKSHLKKEAQLSAFRAKEDNDAKVHGAGAGTGAGTGIGMGAGAGPPGLDGKTRQVEEPTFEPTGKRQRWTVHTTQEKLLKQPPVPKSGFYAMDNSLSHVRSELDLSGSNMSSLVNSFCSSKGLPYYTELAFENREESCGDEPNVEDLELEDKFKVLEQIETPTNPNPLA
jgi:hypothetical protein